MNIIGRLAQGTSKEGGNSSLITAFTTPVGLAQMATSLSLLSAPEPSSRLIIQVANVSTTESSLVLSPSLSVLSDLLFSLPKTVCVLLSATPQESLDMAAIAYQIPQHTVHIFDHYSSSREISNSSQVFKPLPSCTSPKDLLAQMGYKLFDFVGDLKAHTTLVVLNTPLAVIIKSLFKSVIPGLAVIIVRVVRPWDDQVFRDTLPSTTRNVYILEEVPFESSHGGLFTDVFAALFNPIAFTPAVHGFPCTSEKMKQYMEDPESILTSIAGIVPNIAQSIMSSVPTQHERDTKKLLFFSSSHSAGSTALPKSIVDQFTSNPRLLVRHLSTYDTFSKLGGVTVDRIILSNKATAKDYIPLTALIPSSNERSEKGASVDFIGIMDQDLLKTHSLLTSARQNAVILVCSTWTPKEVLANVPIDTLMLIRDRNLRIHLLDSNKLACDLLPYASRSSQENLESVCCLLAFLQLYVGRSGVDGHRMVLQIAKSFYGDGVEGVSLSETYAKCRDALVLMPAPSIELMTELAKPITLRSIEFNSIDPGDLAKHLDTTTAKVDSWHDSAKHIIFREAFLPLEEPQISEEELQIQSLRPDIPERTYLVTTTVNRRLTPKEYNRNVFHLEFDTTRTGLKYAIGEALGVHGWNDADEVLEFCNWYGVDPDSVITIPALGRGGGKTKLMHTRTVFQCLQQQIDIFGKPPKSFYASLSKYATKREDRMALYFISSPEGSSMFKKLSEKDTATYADVLKMYPSAKPPIAELCELVGDIAPRHYSIASSQAAVGDRVDLLVVTVDWMTPGGELTHDLIFFFHAQHAQYREIGSLRYGQCTRYLAGLKEGQKVTVSIKPSVMKVIFFLA